MPYRDLKPESLAKFGKKRRPLRAQESSRSLELFPQWVKLDKSSAEVEHTHTNYVSSQNPSQLKNATQAIYKTFICKVKHLNPGNF